MYNSALFFFVITVVIVNIETRPTEITKRSIDSNEINTSDSEETWLKLPVRITSGVQIIVKGVLDPNHDSFVAFFPNSGDQNCTMMYNFQKQTLDITPSTSYNYIKDYKMEYSEDNENTFILHITAQNGNQTPIFDFTFQGNEHNPSDYLPCQVNRFEDISHIVMQKGVRKINNMMFVFSDS